MGYDLCDSFPFDFEPNGSPFGSENQKENCHHDHLSFTVNGNENIVFSVYTLANKQTHALYTQPKARAGKMYTQKLYMK